MGGAGPPPARADWHLIVSAILTAITVLIIFGTGASKIWPLVLIAIVALLVVGRSSWYTGLSLLVLAHAAWISVQMERLAIRHPQALTTDLIVEQVQPIPASDDWRLVARSRESAHRYRLRAYDLDQRPVLGACLTARLRLRAPVGSVNFYGFDYSRWLFRQGVNGQGSLIEARPCAGKTQPTAAEPSWRHSLMESLPAGQGRALVAALLLADRGEFSANTWRLLGDSGTAHLFAISGLHVGLIAILFWGLGRLIWGWVPGIASRITRPHFAAIWAALAVVAYMTVAAGQVSALRAGLMALIGLGLVASGYRQHLLNLLAIALVLVLLLGPLEILGPGLWLSFLAVVVIALRLPATQGRPALWRLIDIQLCLSLCLAPLVVYFFGRWSLIGIGLNLLLVPAMSLALPALLLAATGALLGLSSPLQEAAEILEHFLALLERLVEWPLAVLAIPEPHWLLVSLLTGSGLMLIAAEAWPRRAVAGCGVVLGLGLANLVAAPPAHGQARLTVVDVGQGQAVLIQTQRHWVVVDAGPAFPRSGFDAGERIVLPQLLAQGAEALALLVVSHADLDHAGGAEALVRKFPVERRWGAGGEDCESGLHWQGDGVYLRSLVVGIEPDWSRNNRSCVLVLEAGGRKVLLPGDIEAQAERRLLPELQRMGGVDVALVPHHGSASSSSEGFVTAVNAGLVVVSAGRDNRWGFPKPHVRRKWQKAGAQLLSTQAGGLEIDLPALSVERPARRAWHFLDAAPTADAAAAL